MPAGTLPEQFGRYRILKKLGHGGMGSVYLAQDTQLERQVALKVPHIEPDDGSNVLERFFREARAAATLHHPNLCQVFDVGTHDNIPYLTMAFVEGRTLAEVLKNGQPLPQREAAAIVHTLALALQEAHAGGVIHRDLKPANVIINPRGEPVVMDFGIALQTSRNRARLTQLGSVMGTPTYMPPEQVKGDVEAMGPGCDIYSLGIILYELLTARVPFAGPIAAVLGQILTQPPERPSVHRPDLDPRLEVICLRATQKNAGARYANMGELAAALADYMRGPPSSITATPPAVRKAVAVPAKARVTAPARVRTTNVGPTPAGRRHVGMRMAAIALAAAVTALVIVSAAGLAAFLWWSGNSAKSDAPVTAMQTKADNATGVKSTPKDAKVPKAKDAPKTADKVEKANDAPTTGEKVEKTKEAPKTADNMAKDILKTGDMSEKVKESPKVADKIESAKGFPKIADLPTTRPQTGTGTWLKRHEGFVDIARKGDVDILLLGDSIMEGWRNPAARPGFFPAKAANFGLAGDKTQNLLWRLQNGELDSIQPRVVVVLIGTNNAQDTAGDIAEGITAVVKTVLEKVPTARVLLMGILPRGEKADTPLRAKIAETNSIIAKLDDGNRIRYLDIASKLLLPKGLLPKEIMPDYLHLSAHGYEILGEAIQPVVQEMLGNKKP